MSLLSQLKANTQLADSEITQTQEQTVNTLCQLIKELDAVRIFEDRHAQTDREESFTQLVTSS
jgi:uncharacterized protein (DUF362 family)